MMPKPMDDPTKEEMPDHPADAFETYDTGKGGTVIYDPENPIAWIESSNVVDLGDVV